MTFVLTMTNSAEAGLRSMSQCTDLDVSNKYQISEHHACPTNYTNNSFSTNPANLKRHSMYQVKDI